MRILLAALGLTLAAHPASAEVLQITCQPDRKIENGVSQTLTDNQKARGTQRYVFAYDLAEGKACLITTQYQMCTPNAWEVKPATDAPEDLVFIRRTSTGLQAELVLVKPATGRFRSEVHIATKPPSTVTLTGGAGACTPFTDFTVELPK